MCNCAPIDFTKGSSTYVEKGISFHQIQSEKKKSLLQQWRHSIRCAPPVAKDSNYYIFSFHFEKTSFKRGLGSNKIYHIPKTFATHLFSVVDKIIWQFTVFPCKFDLPQVKRNLISNITNFVYELFNKLPNDLRISIL